MNTDVRTAGVNGAHRGNSAHGRALNLLLSLVVLATAGCGDMAPPAASPAVGPQSGLPAPGSVLHTLPANVSQTATGPPAAGLATGADETAVDSLPVGSVANTHIVFLYRLHSPFGTALAMSQATP